MLPFFLCFEFRCVSSVSYSELRDYAQSGDGFDDFGGDAKSAQWFSHSDLVNVIERMPPVKERQG